MIKLPLGLALRCKVRAAQQGLIKIHISHACNRLRPSCRHLDPQRVKLGGLRHFVVDLILYGLLLKTFQVESQNPGNS